MGSSLEKGLGKYLMGGGGWIGAQNSWKTESLGSRDADNSWMDLAGPHTGR